MLVLPFWWEIFGTVRCDGEDGCASAVLSLALKSAPQTAQRWLLFGGIALLVLGFLVSVTFYRCPHCHRVLPANRGKMDDCPYCKLPLRDTK